VQLRHLCSRDQGLLLLLLEHGMGVGLNGGHLGDGRVRIPWVHWLRRDQVARLLRLHWVHHCKNKDGQGL